MGISGNYDIVSDLKECGYYDVQQVQLIIQYFFNTVAADSVEKASVDRFKQPIFFVEEFKNEMLEYLHQQVEANATGSGTIHFQSPANILGDVLQTFLRSKRRSFRCVLRKILSEDINGRIDEFS